MDWYYRLRVAHELNSTRGDLYLRAVYLPRLKAIYLTTPKVAGSTIISTLVRADGSDRFSGIGDHNESHARHILSSAGDPKAFWQKLHDPTVFRFAFVRNPYDRVISAYLDKIATGRVRRYKKLLKLPPDGEVTFLDFLWAVSKQKVRRMNRHWRPQSALISPKVQLDFLGRFEQFDADFNKVLQRLGVGDVPVNNRREHKTSAVDHRNIIGPEEKALIDRIYSDDFERFGYPKILPGG